MEIEKIKIEKYKALEFIEMSFENKHLIFTGMNGAGKTQLLEFICLYFNGEFSKKNILDKKFFEYYETGPVKIEVFFKATKSNEKKKFEKIISDDDKFSFGIKFNKYSTKYICNGKVNEKDDKSQLYSDIVDCFEIIYFGQYDHINNFESVLSSDIFRKNRLKSKIINDEAVGKFKDGLPSYFDSIKINDNSKFSVGVQYFNDGKILDINSLNSGHSKEFYYHLVNYISKKKSGKKIICLSDEFDIHYHPQMQIKEYIKLTKNSDYSVITTHSRELVDYFNFKNTYNISNGLSMNFHDVDKTLTQITRLSGKVLFSKFMIFVEGKSDKIFIEMVIRKFYDEDDIIDVIELGGRSNALKIAKFMNKYKFNNYLMLLDRDFVSEAQEKKKFPSYKSELNRDFKSIAPLTKNIIVNEYFLESEIYATDYGKKFINNKLQEKDQSMKINDLNYSSKYKLEIQNLFESYVSNKSTTIEKLPVSVRKIINILNKCGKNDEFSIDFPTIFHSEISKEKNQFIFDEGVEQKVLDYVLKFKVHRISKINAYGIPINEIAKSNNKFFIIYDTKTNSLILPDKRTLNVLKENSIEVDVFYTTTKITENHKKNALKAVGESVIILNHKNKNRNSFK